jgi:hypothetical protein
MRRRVYIKALDHPERNRNLLAEMVFTPFYTDIGLANPWHEVLAFGWLAENTRDIWYPGYAYVHNNEWGGFCRHLFIGFANEQDLENFQVFWELRDRSIYL